MVSVRVHFTARRSSDRRDVALGGVSMSSQPFAVVW